MESIKGVKSYQNQSSYYKSIVCPPRERLYIKTVKPYQNQSSYYKSIMCPRDRLLRLLNPIRINLVIINQLYAPEIESIKAVNQNDKEHYLRRH